MDKVWSVHGSACSQTLLCTPELITRPTLGIVIPDSATFVQTMHDLANLGSRCATHSSWNLRGAENVSKNSGANKLLFWPNGYLPVEASNDGSERMLLRPHVKSVHGRAMESTSQSTLNQELSEESRRVGISGASPGRNTMILLDSFTPLQWQASSIRGLPTLSLW